MKSEFSQKTKGILSILGSCFFYFVIGSTYIWGSVNIYASSYFKSFSNDLTSIVFPFSILITNIGILLSFPIVALIGFKMTIYIASLLVFGFLLASSFCQSFWSFFLCFSVGFGGSSGLLYLTLMYNGYKYFPEKRGLIGGILMGMYGLASLISNYIMLLLVNPDNVAPMKRPGTEDFFLPDEVSQRFPISLRYLSFYFLGMMTMGCLLIFEYKEIDCIEERDELKFDMTIEDMEKSGLKTHLLPETLKQSEAESEKKQEYIVDLNETTIPDPLENSLEQDLTYEHKEEVKLKTKRKIKGEWSDTSVGVGDEQDCHSIKDAFSSRVAYVIMGMMFLSVSNGYFLAANFKNYGMTKIPNDSFLTLVGSLSSLCNGGGRIFWGILSDKFDFKKVYTIILLIQLLDIATLRFISNYELPYLIWISVALLCEGGNFVIFPPLSLKVFGPSVGSKTYSLLLIFCAVSNIFQFSLNFLLRPIIGFENEFMIFFIMTMFAMVLCRYSDLRFKKRII